MIMITSRNISLKPYNSFGIDVTADSMIRLKSEDEAVDLFDKREKLTGPVLILGGGSNILFAGDYKGTIIRPEFTGIRTEYAEGSDVVISSGAGVIWDDLVEWTVEKGLGGMENLSLIPGTIGATPVQNIGAYGVEVSELITRVDTVSTSNGRHNTFDTLECGFGYRTSIFKKEIKGDYLITRVYYRLSTEPVYRLDYGALKEELATIGSATLRNVRKAVVNVRRRKLPDPEITGNAGSFFKNPVIPDSFAAELTGLYPGIPMYNDMPGYKKVAAGWLIEQCGWKGLRKGDAGVHGMQALVLVNYGNASGRDIYDLSEEIKTSVENRFSILLEREVEIAGSI